VRVSIANSSSLQASSLPEWVLLVRGTLREVLRGGPVLGHAQLLLLEVNWNLGRAVWQVTGLVDAWSTVSLLLTLELDALQHGSLGLVSREGKTLVRHLMHLLGLHCLNRGRVGVLVVHPVGRLLGLKLLLSQMS